MLRFRYTSYLGVDHPSQKKVVMTFTVRDLRNALQADSRIDDVWEHKFKLLCGPRYNFETDVVHMSCDQYPYPAQNKRWLSDKLDEMIQLATVHHLPFVKLTFVVRRIIRRYPSRHTSC